MKNIEKFTNLVITYCFFSTLIQDRDYVGTSPSKALDKQTYIMIH
jgi:hypothetical protein